MFGISRQGYYQKQQRVRNRLQELSEVKSEVVSERIYLPRLGTRKLYHRLKERFQDRGIKIGRDALFAFLRSEHMLIRKHRSYHKTTNSKHWLRKYPNLMSSRTPLRPNEIWVSDITYIETKEKVSYLSLLTDAYSRKIVGHYLHESLHTDGVAAALKSAIRQEKIDRPLIHHSDRGLQYCSAQYQHILSQHGIIPSMTDGYDCYQNALAERINGIIKEEFLLTKPDDIEQARTIIDQSVKLYNERRPHLSLNYLTPDQVHKNKKSLPVLTDKDYIYS